MTGLRDIGGRLPVGGHVRADLRPVQAAFQANLHRFGDGGGAMAVHLDGELVVDLWGGWAAPDRPWQRDTLVVMMSATKALAGLCVQVLVDQGRIDVDEPVATYWPEFAQAGKASVLVRHVLTHTSGVLGFDGLADLLWPDGRGFAEHDRIAQGLAASSPSWPPGTRLGYQALSYGWLVEELVRRVAGTDAGTFFATHVAGPLDLDVHLGTGPGDVGRVAAVLGFSTLDMPLLARPLLGLSRRLMRRDGTLLARAYGGGGGHTLLDNVEQWMNDPDYLGVPVGSANGTATARDLSRLYAAIGAGGSLHETRILRTETARRFGEPAVALPDELLMSLPGLRRLPALAQPIRRSLGYLINPAVLGQRGTFGPNPIAFGHDGAGGQIGFCDPQAGIAVAFLRNHLSAGTRLSTELIETVYDCVRPSLAAG